MGATYSGPGMARRASYWDWLNRPRSRRLFQPATTASFTVIRVAAMGQSALAVMP